MMRFAPIASKLAIALTVASASLNASALEAGAASCDVSPDVEKYDVPMAGYGARQGKPSTGVHDPIMAKVLYLRDADTELVIITTDLRSVTPDLKLQIVERAGIATLSNENVLVCASHNHSGPSLYPEKFWQLQFGEYDPAIVEVMSAAIADAVNTARRNLQPARVGFGESSVPDFSRNRRWGYDEAAREAANETPCVDPRLWAMRVDGPNGNLRAALVRFATHPTILGADNFEISAEWPGALQRELEDRYAGATILYANGAEGDQAPAGARGDSDFEKVDDFGSRLAEHAAALIDGIDTQKGLPIAYAYSTPALPEPYFSDAADEGRYAFMKPFAMEALPRRAVLQQFRIGDVVLAALPGEPICEVGRDTEQRLRKLGAEQAVVIGLANDYLGYILNAKEYAHGGYEVDSRSFYGPGLGMFIAKKTAESAAELFEFSKVTD